MPAKTAWGAKTTAAPSSSSEEESPVEKEPVLEAVPELLVEVVAVPLAYPVLVTMGVAVAEPEVTAGEETVGSVTDGTVETVMVEPSTTVSPAGMVDTSGWEVTAAGCEGCEVTTDGWPVTTPLESVWVRNWTAGLDTEVIEESAGRATAWAAAARMATTAKERILRLLRGMW